MAGVGPRFLAARWPDDAGIYRAIAEAARTERHAEAKEFARLIANAVSEMLDG